jgi:hypothetical protein
VSEPATSHRCPDCDEPFTHEVDLGIHGYLRHAVQPHWFEEPGKRGHTSACPDCGERWGRGLGLTVHRGVAHPAPPPVLEELLPGYTPLGPTVFRFGGHRFGGRATPPPPPRGPDDDED